MYYTYFFKHYYQKSTQKYTIYTSSNITTKKVRKKLLCGLLWSFVGAKVYYIYFFKHYYQKSTQKYTIYTSSNITAKKVHKNILYILQTLLPKKYAKLL